LQAINPDDAGAIMRTLLATTVVIGSIFALSPTADARKAKRNVQPQYYYAPPADYRRQQVECERARNEDPAGHFAGYPCWAREIFGRGRNTGRGG
jgi:hypothetical protein